MIEELKLKLDGVRQVNPTLTYPIMSSEPDVP
jgi:hypothetical protein